MIGYVYIVNQEILLSKRRLCRGLACVLPNDDFTSDY